MWRAHKLSKRIKYDKRIDIGERRHLQQRLNIISFRLRVKYKNMEKELIDDIMPNLHNTVR